MTKTIKIYYEIEMYFGLEKPEWIFYGFGCKNIREAKAYLKKYQTESPKAKLRILKHTIHTLHNKEVVK